MPLSILPDETLPSYVRRNLLLYWAEPKAEIFEALRTRHVIKTAEVRRLAEAIGWPGCYGFNRLVHNHTLNAAFHVIKSDWDVAYSGTRYLSEGEHFSEWDASFCPECVREDLKIHGFSYWRRYGASKVSVCPKHNAVLIRDCPFCGKSFTRMDHDLDVMWRTCGGRHLAEAEVVANHDPLALKRAEVYQRLCRSPHIISGLHAAKVLLDKATALSPQLNGEERSKMQAIASTMSDLVQRFADVPSPSLESRAGTITAVFIHAVVALYDSYDDFERELMSLVGSTRCTDSLWSSYRIEDTKYVHFVEEDYVQGLGVWSSPRIVLGDVVVQVGWPWPTSKHDPCCNTPLSIHEGSSQRNTTVAASPSIPKIGLANARAIGIIK
ncbi:TniQ family protein [Pseudomonas sp. LS.1a]|uniref:TniQ family protein n=1 Tax=Pseudomonas sp. LS.1a TaxID=2920387 RepID=UPI001F12B521|nr:TniQ family protein [Pseudomonas sp. LS.1a]UMY61681.1 TniQ family protein [Pseudomonas sp. LS.1a]